MLHLYFVLTGNVKQASLQAGYTGARPMQREWVISVRRQCRQQNVPFFFKQWGGVRKSKNGRILDGRTYDEMPTAFVANGSVREQHEIAERQRLVAQG